MGRTAAFPRIDPLAGALLALGLIAAMVLGVVAASGNLATGPRIIDDNQIFSLSDRVSRVGFRITLAEQLRTRADEGRLIPVFLAEKVLKARVYKGRVGLWKAHVVALGILSGAVFYFVLVLAGYNRLESLAFALLVVTGPQSVLWVRLIHGEGLGLLLFALSLGCLVGAVRSDRWRPAFDAAFVLSIVAAALAKESFALTVPALLLWRLVLERDLRGASLRRALARSRWVLSAMALFGLACLIVSLFLWERFKRWYVGYDRIDPARLARSGEELVVATGAWWSVPALAACLALVAVWCRGRPGLRRRLAGLGATLAVGVLLVVPQVVLYHKLGFSRVHLELTVSRYLVPAVCGVALVLVALARAARELLEAGDRPPVMRRLALAVPVVLLALAVAHQALAAYARTEAFAEQTEAQNELMDFIRLNTEKGDVVLVVYDGHRLRRYQRMAAILRHFVERPRVMRFPVASTKPLRQARDVETRSRTLEALQAHGEAPGAIVVERREHVWEAFLREAGGRFRPECHRRRSFPRRNDVYIPTRCGATEFMLETDTEARE